MKEFNMGYFVWDFNPVFFTLFGVGIKYYAIFAAIGFNIIINSFYKFFKKENVEEKSINIFLISGIVLTIWGARLSEALFYSFDYFKDHILEIFLPLKITENGIFFSQFSGLSSHGGVFGALLVIFIFCKIKKISILKTLDENVKAIYITCSLIRIGNFFNSELLGIRTDSIFGVIFSRVDDCPRYPVQIFESIFYFSIAFLHYYLMIKFKKNEKIFYKDGFVFSLSATLMFTSRIILEFIKEPVSYSDNIFYQNYGIKYGQMLSLIFIIIFMIIFFIKKPSKKQL